MNNQLQLVSFEQAKRLKEAGFDLEIEDIYWCDGDYEHNYCLGNWNDYIGEEEGCISAPTVAIALKWFRDVKSIKNEVRFYYTSNDYREYYYQGYYDYKNHKSLGCTKHFDTYELAESALLDELLTLIEKKNE
jgi:hypothetical protein